MAEAPRMAKQSFSGHLNRCARDVLDALVSSGQTNTAALCKI
jgi:hypothetical protein